MPCALETQWRVNESNSTGCEKLQGFYCSTSTSTSAGPGPPVFPTLNWGLVSFLFLTENRSRFRIVLGTRLNGEHCAFHLASWFMHARCVPMCVLRIKALQTWLGYFRATIARFIFVKTSLPLEITSTSQERLLPIRFYMPLFYFMFESSATVKARFYCKLRTFRAKVVLLPV